MIDTSYSTLSTYSSYSTRGSRTVGDGEDSPISENQLFTPCIQHNGETPKFNPLRTVVGTGLKYRSTSLSVLYEQRRDDIAHASLQQQLLAKQSPIEERADIERIELELDISEDPLLDDSSVIVTGKELLSVSQPLASTLCDTSLMVATAVSRSTLCNSESDSDHTPTGSPSLIVKLRHQVSKSAIIERATSMQSLSSSNQLPERGEPIKPILSHPLSNASSMQQLNNLSPSLSPAGESKLFRRLDDSNTQFSFSTNNIAIVGTEKGLSRAFSRGGKGRKKLPNIPNSPMIYSVNKTTLETKETLGEKLRDNLDTFVTRTDGLTPELIVRAYPEYNSIVELAVKIVKGSMRSTSVGVCTEIDSEYSLVATEVSNNFVKLQELVNEMSNQFSLLK